MEVLLLLLISALLTGALTYANDILTSIVPIALHAERYMASLTGRLWFEDVYGIVFSFGTSLIVLKFLKKGFETYVLWTEGDPDADPIGLLTGFFKAMVVAVGFPTMYSWLRGLEIVILRIGVPIACVGLLDSDKGVFGAYIKKFFQSTLAVVLQITLAKLAVGMLLNSHIFWGIAAMMLALKTPRFLQDFILAGGGGGGITNNIYHTSRLVQMVRGAMKK